MGIIILVLDMTNNIKISKSFYYVILVDLTAIAILIFILLYYGAKINSLFD